MDPLNTEGSPGTGSAAPAQPTPTQSKCDWLVDNHLVVLLALAFAVGLSLPALGQGMSDPEIDLGPFGKTRLFEFLFLIAIFFIAGFRLKTDAVAAALRSPKPLIVAILLIAAVTPLVGFVAVVLPFAKKELSYGLAIFCCVPTTLTSGAALVSGCPGTERATELALLTTVSTNLLGSFTTPLMLSLVLGGAEVALDAGQLLAKLVVSILVPTLVGKAARELIPGAAALSKDWKVPLTVLSNIFLVLIVWMSVSRSQGDIVTQPASQILACIVSGVVLHFVFWLVTAPLVAGARIPDLHHRRAVFLLASQKTLPVSVAVVAELPASFGEAGLLILPCIFGHLAQLVVDSCLVQRWAQKKEEALFPRAQDR